MVLNLPNLLSTLRIFLSPIFIWLILSDEPVNIGIAIVLFFIAAITDFFDGWIARRYKDVTEWGAFFDPLADKVLTNSALVAFAMKGWIPLWMVFVIIIRDIAVTLLRLYGESVGQPIRTRRSAKWKTLLQMVFILYTLIIYFFLYPLGIHAPLLQHLFQPETLTTLFGIVTAVTLYTAIEYAVSNRPLFQHLWHHKLLPLWQQHPISKLGLSLLGIGYIPALPGTIASAVSLGVWYWLMPIPVVQQLLGIAVLLLLGIFATHRLRLSHQDPSWVVLDETIGMLIAVLWLPDGFSFLHLLAVFFLFRFFDIWKPPLIQEAEQLPYVGIFADDILAALAAGIIVAIFG